MKVTGGAVSSRHARFGKGKRHPPPNTNVRAQYVGGVDPSDQAWWAQKAANFTTSGRAGASRVWEDRPGGRLFGPETSSLSVCIPHFWHQSCYSKDSISALSPAKISSRLRGYSHGIKTRHARIDIVVCSTSRLVWFTKSKRCPMNKHNMQGRKGPALTRSRNR